MRNVYVEIGNVRIIQIEEVKMICESEDITRPVLEMRNRGS